MGKFDGILVCTDLDGTLYKNDKTISAENKQAIEYFKREGGYFTFITGRFPYYSFDAYNAIKPNAPFGCINGGGLYDGVEGKYIYTTAISDEVVELIDCIHGRFDNVGIQICCFDKTYFVEENEMTERFRKRVGLPNLICHYRDVKEPIGKVIFTTDGSSVMQTIEKILRSHSLSDKFEFIRSERTLFEIMPKGVNKGTGLLKLSKHLGVDIGKTVAIGDFDNDVAMLKAARLGIAVANASKLALEAADIVTVSNEENAIADVIYGLESGKYHL